jgi:hypothetical protein
MIEDELGSSHFTLAVAGVAEYHAMPSPTAAASAQGSALSSRLSISSMGQDVTQ